MIIAKLFCLFFLDYCVATYFREMQCNFSIYFINFFNHNKLYLQELHENKSKYDESDVKAYGTAIQSHGEVIMVMLDVLRILVPFNYSTELMAINLYLNNVSNSLDMIGKNDDGTFDRLDNTSSLIKGYRLIHEDIEKQLQDYVKNYCSYIVVDRVFVELPNYNKGEDLHPKNLENVLNQLKNIILNNNTQVDMNLQTELLQNSFVFGSMISAINRSMYDDFHPKKLLFYNLMTGQRDFIENGINQERKKPKINEYGQLEDVLDLLRFSELNAKCPDGSPLTVYDAFRYTKYSFARLTLRCFEMLVQAAAMRPFILLIRFYSLVFNSAVYLYGFDTRRGDAKMFYANMISLGNEIAQHSQNFINLNLFGNYSKGHFDILPSKVKLLLNQFKQKNIVQFKETAQFFLNEAKHLLKTNIFEHRYEFVKVDKNNVNNYYQQLIDNFEQLKKFTIELEKHKDLFYIVNRTMVTTYKLYYRNTYFVRPDIKEVLCKENIYSHLKKTKLDNSDEGSNDEDEFDNFDLGDINNEIKNVEVSQEKKLGHKQGQPEESINCYSYMIDYLLSG